MTPINIPNISIRDVDTWPPDEDFETTEVLVHSEENNQEVLVQCEEEVGMNLVFFLFSQRYFLVIRKFIT